jgi:hypothetical protein
MTLDEMRAYYAMEQEADETGRSDGRWSAEMRDRQSARRRQVLADRAAAAARESKVFTFNDADRVDILIDGRPLD